MRDRYEIIEKIGEGMQSEVFKVRDTRTGCIHVYKRYKDHESKCEAFAREKTWLQQSRLPGIPCLIDLIDCQQELGFIMEWIDGVSLQDWMENKDKKELNRLAYDYIQVMVGIVESCRNLNLEHMHLVDLKPEHVMVDALGRVRLIDFGLCTISENDNWIGFGPTYFTDPYTLISKLHNFQSDLFAISSVTLYILASGNPCKGKEDSHKWALGIPNWMIHMLLKMREIDITYRYRDIDSFLFDWRKKRIA